MAQHDYNIANQTGANFRADLNNALSAISSNNSGSSEPSTTFAYEWWIDTSTNVLKLRNSSNNAWVTMPFSITSDNTVDINAGTVNGITSLSFSSGSTVASILDEDNLASDSATALATQQSIKAYVDSQVTAQDLDITDGSSTIAIDLDSETLSLLGGTGVTSTASGNGVTFAIGQSVGTSDNVVFNQVTGSLVGNSSTATALATARTISGVSFDGTSNITLDTDNIGEGSSNLYYTNARVDTRFDTRLATKTTDNLTEGSSNKYFTNERVDDQVNTLLTAGANISLTYDDAAGTLTIANTNSADITSVVAGDGLTGGGTSGDVTLAVGVDDSSIEINSDALRVKASGITNAMLAGSIANAKLANSSITVNSQAISLGGSHTFDTDDIGEGSSNLYYTDARANSAIDARVTNTFINNLSGVVADTATALATGRTIGLSGDVTASGVSFDGTGNITLSTTIAANSIALGTDTVGNYVATIAGTTNEIDVSGSGSETATVTIGLPDDVTIAGNLTVNGTTTTVNSDTLSVTDPLIKLAKANSGADSLDIGFYGLYDTSGSQDLYAGLFRDANDSGKFKLFKDLQVEPTTTVNTSGTGYAVGTLVSNLEGSVTGTVSSISNHSTSDLGEGTNLYFTNARSRSAISASGDISYNSSTGVISFTQSASAVTSVNSATGAVVLDTDDIAEGSSNLYMTTERVQDIVGGMVTGNTETGITVTYEDSDGTLDFVVGTLNQDTTGNAATATALETARAIALSGDVVGTANFDGTAGISISTTIQANSVALGTDTTGDYVGTITGGTGITSTGATSGEGVAHSLSVDAAQTQITSVGTLTSFRSTGIDDNADALAITIDSSERVGINTTSPNANLHVGSSAATGDATNPAIQIGGSSTYRMGLYTSSEGAVIENANGDDGIQFRVKTAGEAMRIDGGTGLVGIGNSSPSSYNAAAQNLVVGSSGDTGITIASGTASNGSIHFADGTSGDAQYRGIITYDHSSDKMQFNTAGTARLRIDSSGNVGIGTASPSRLLETVATNAGADITALQVRNNNSSTSTSTSIRFVNSTSGTSTAGGGEISAVRNASDGGALTFKTAADSTATLTERMRIDSNGTVKMSVNGSVANLTLENDADKPFMSFTESGSAKFFIGESSGVGGGDGFYDMYAAASVGQRFFTGAAERMRIDSSGKVGIGLTNPDAYYNASLAVSLGSESSLTLASTNTTNWNYILFADGTSGDAAYRGQVAYNHQNDILALASSGYMSFSSGSGRTERMRITSGGNLGLGDSSPANFSGYVVASLADSTGAILDFKTTGSEGVFARIQGAVNNGLFITNEQAYPIAFNTNATERMRIDGSGKVQIGTTSALASSTFSVKGAATNSQQVVSLHNPATSGTVYFMAFGTEASYAERGYITYDQSNVAFTQTSDITLKENIRDLDNGLDTICKIKPRVFDWKDGHAKDSVGFIAQEVEEVKPDWVKEKEGIKMLDTNLPNTIPYLIKAIQEQQEQIDALQSEINKLKGE